MKRKSILREKSVAATFLLGVIIIVLFLMSSYQASKIIRARSVLRMEEGVNTVVAEVVSKLEKDSRMLHAAADIISSAEYFSEESILEVAETIMPLLETTDICVLLPNNRILQPEGAIVDGAGHLDFQTEAAKGEHVSHRVISIEDENTYILRHFVPIMQDGQVVALVYGRTWLEELPGVINIDNLYNASADVYIIDAETGDFLMDTRHETLGNLDDFPVGEVQGDGNWEDIKRAIMNEEAGYVVFQSVASSESEIEENLNFYYTPAGINHWEIAVSVPEKEAMKSMNAVQRIFYLAGALMLIVIAIYYYWIQRNAKKTMKEVVERVVLEEKLQKAEAAERAKTTFLNNMSHDIRTPMNAIIGFATIARNNIDNKERVHEYLGKILSSGNYLLSLINDVLDMSRIESGKLNIEEKPCCISDIFQDMRNIIQTQMQSKQLNFYMDTVDIVDEDIFCDKLHVNQVLLNLLSNAIKYTPAGGTVSLTIRQMPDAPEGFGSYEIRVKDTGIGMTQEFVKIIFEPFERERNSTISGIQGTGLGMAITKSVVDAMGGTIQVETEEGKGSEFIICLNFRLQSDRKEIEASEALTGLHALVVDDSFTTCDSITKMLTQLGMQTEWYMHGREAVLRAHQAMEMEDEFSVYLVDWALPDLSGLEVIRQIRSMVGDEAVIVVITAYERSVFEEEARQAGANAFCNKPVFLSELRNVLENAIHKKEETDTLLSSPDTDDSLNGKRLLLVEDNELNREIAEELLSEEGFVVETAEDGTIAVEKVKAAEAGWYDMILMDVQMPIMNGYEATKAIRALPDQEKAAIPIVAMTANAFEEDRQRALESGMNDYVAKPIDVEKLFAVIYRLLNSKQ